MYFNKAQIGIISQSVAQLLLRKLGAFFDRYRRWVASLLLISIADTGNHFDLGNETGRYADILINWQIHKAYANVILFAERRRNTQYFLKETSKSINTYKTIYLKLEQFLLLLSCPTLMDRSHSV